MAVLLDRFLGGTPGPCRHPDPFPPHHPVRAPHNRLRGPGPNGPPNGPRTSACARSLGLPAAAFPHELRETADTVS